MKGWSNFSLSSSTLSCPTTVTAKEPWEGQPIHRQQALQAISKSKDGIPTDLRCVCSMISNLFCGSILELVILYISNNRAKNLMGHHNNPLDLLRRLIIQFHCSIPGTLSEALTIHIYFV